LAFERHCGACHLTAGETTPFLPIASPREPDRPGVETPEQMTRRGGLGTRWAYFVNPAEFTVRGTSKVQKGPLNHADPWVMENLLRIRRRLHPQAGLADLLDALPAVAVPGPALARELYEEALAVLIRQAEELAGSPDTEVQAELEALFPLLKAVEQRLGAGEELPAGAFDPGPPASDLSPEDAEGWRQLAADLARPCLKCHLLEDGALLRVDQEQRSFPAARFHHRQHVIQRPLCTDCHGAIGDLFAREEAEGEVAPRPEDQASTQNLPRLAVCQDCHRRGRVADSCVRCHRFHPEEHFRADLLLLRPSKEVKP
ncbi:MAG: cytochrome c3 family protein, partial [Acidobacteria bacterium]|nr:cytochrome c3 family protein [Acidobacteriota bacterium]